MKSKLDSIPLFNDVISIDKQHKKYRDRISSGIHSSKGKQQGGREDKLDPKGVNFPIIGFPICAERVPKVVQTYGLQDHLVTAE